MKNDAKLTVQSPKTNAKANAKPMATGTTPQSQGAAGATASDTIKIAPELLAIGISEAERRGETLSGLLSSYLARFTPEAIAARREYVKDPFVEYSNMHRPGSVYQRFLETWHDAARSDFECTGSSEDAKMREIAYLLLSVDDTPLGVCSAVMEIAGTESGELESLFGLLECIAIVSDEFDDQNNNDRSTDEYWKLSILDSSGNLRRRFHASLARSPLTEAAFIHSLLNAGLSVIEAKRAGTQSKQGA
ncbi:MAG: hypothetical protein VB042_10495 [Victivallaceae bacterium]|nr:hypothetical protein [Victivallaceae bacterium]